MAANKEALAKLLASSEKKYGFPVAPLSQIASKASFISTGNVAIDYVIGGGIPLGRVTEISGLPSSGKSTTALQAAVTLQQIITGGGSEELKVSAEDKIYYADFEQALDPEYAKALGLDVDHESFLFSQPSSLEKGSNFINEIVKTGMVRMVIIDSVAAMIPESKMDGQVGDYHVGVKARLITDFVEVLNSLAAEHNVAVVLLNHTKEKIGMGRPGMPPVRTTPGGVGAKFYASVRLEYEQRKQYKSSVFNPILGESEDTVTATDVMVKTIKNKLAPPFRKQLVRVRFGEGFDNFFTSVMILVAHKKIMYNAGIFYFHKIDDIGGAPEWMPRQTTGTNRPYLKGEQNLYNAAKEDHGWARLIQDLAREIVHNPIEDVLDAEE